MCWITDDESECSATSPSRSHDKNNLDSHGTREQEGLNERDNSDSESRWLLAPDLTCPLCAHLLRWGGTHHKRSALTGPTHSEGHDKMSQQGSDQCKVNSNGLVSQASDVPTSEPSPPKLSPGCTESVKSASHTSGSPYSGSWITGLDSSGQDSLDSDSNCSRSNCVDSACLDHTIALVKLQLSSERDCRVCDLIFRGAQCFLTPEQENRPHERRLRLMYGSPGPGRFSVCDRGEIVCTFSFFHLPGKRHSTVIFQSYNIPIVSSYDVLMVTILAEQASGPHCLLW